MKVGAPLTECTDPIEWVEDDLNSIIQESANQPYDIKDVIYKIVDYSEFLEIHASYARNIVVGFAKMGGIPVGIVANQPLFSLEAMKIENEIKADPNDHLLMHAMTPNISGVIGSAVAAGILLGFLG